MRVTREKSAENRERILSAAARLMRERGITGVGVDELAAAAGMTHGSLYSQFGSKEQLVEETVSYAIAAKGRELPAPHCLETYVSEYLSVAHRDAPGTGCPLAALSCDVTRQGESVRARFTAGVRGMIGRLSRCMPSSLKPKQRDEAALAAMASLVGALVLARAVNDPELSEGILRATGKQLTKR